MSKPTYSISVYCPSHDYFYTLFPLPPFTINIVPSGNTGCSPSSLFYVLTFVLQAVPMFSLIYHCRYYYTIVYLLPFTWTSLNQTTAYSIPDGIPPCFFLCPTSHSQFPSFLIMLPKYLTILSIPAHKPIQC